MRLFVSCLRCSRAMQASGVSEEHRATLFGVIADCQHVVEVLPRELIHVLGAVRPNVDARFLHNGYRLRANAPGFCASAFHHEPVPVVVAQQPFRHLRPRGIAGA